MSTSSKKQVSVKALAINDYSEGYTDITAAVSKKEQAVLTLYDNGMIRDCNRIGGRLLGCTPCELTGQHFTRLLPELGGINLMRGKQVNPYLYYRSRIGHQFEVVSLKGRCFSCELFFSDVENLGQHYLRVIIFPAR